MPVGIKKDLFDSIDLEIDNLQNLKVQSIVKVIHHDRHQHLAKFKDDASNMNKQ